MPVLLIAHAPEGEPTMDRIPLTARLSVGRDRSADLTVRDSKLSRQHFAISCAENGMWIEDQGSTNGTYLNGSPLKQLNEISTGDVIRAGRCLFVIEEDGAALLDALVPSQFGLVGPFHAAPLLNQLKEAALSRRHLLLTGASGTGKELAARAVAQILAGTHGTAELVVHNAARFSSEEEATSTLFGVAPRVFSTVDPRPGLIEQAGSGVLFLDEVHNLPERVQRSLLRVIEDGQIARIGEINTRRSEVRFVLASNAEGPTFSLAPDLLARLRVIELPPLATRRADIPAIFTALLSAQARQFDVDGGAILQTLRPKQYEQLMVDGFPVDNVRGLLDVADRIASRFANTGDAVKAVTTVFAERYGQSVSSSGGESTDPSTQRSAPPRADVDAQPVTPVVSKSSYEWHKEVIISTYRHREQNISATERAMRKQGISCSRKWLARYLTKWGER